jgi:hypothetical protein
LSTRVTRQAVFPSFEEFLRPGIIQALCNPLAVTQRGDALLATQARQDDPDLLLGRVVLAGLALMPLTSLSAASFDVPDVLFIFAP